MRENAFNPIFTVCTILLAIPFICYLLFVCRSCKGIEDGKEKKTRIPLNLITFSGFTTIFGRGMFSWTNKNNRVSRLWRFRNIMESFFGKLWIRRSVMRVSVQLVMFNRGCIPQETQHVAKASGLDKHVRFYWQSKEKLRYLEVTEKEFLFITRAPIFLSKRRLLVLSEVSWKIIVFVFIYFISCLFYSFLLLVVFSFLSNPYRSLSSSW